jgi:beta-N-acetylhexosaminidase
VVVRDAARLLPLDAAKGRVLVVAPGVEVGEPPLFIGHTLGNAIRALAAPTDEVRIELEPSPAQSEAALRKAAGADVIVFGALLPNVFTTQAELVRKLVETGKPLILVGLGDPGSILPLADLPTLVVAHGFSPPALDAAAAVLYGKQPPGGRLTAPIGRLFPAGHAGP